MDEPFRITHQAEDARYVDKKIVKEIRVEFMVGDDGPFSERFPKEGFTAEGRNATLRAFALNLRR